jgi:hypothetical protein
MNDPLIRGPRPSRANPDGAPRAVVCKFMRSMPSRAVVALNRNAFLNERLPAERAADEAPSSSRQVSQRAD